MKTLQHYIDKKHVRYMPAEIKAELSALVPRCLGDAAEQMFWVQHQLGDYPKCKACSTQLSSFHWEPFLKPSLRVNQDIKQGYRPFCSRECAYGEHGTKQAAYKATCLSRYGVEHPMQTEEVIAKLKATNIDKYGDSSPMRWTGKKFLDIINNKYGVSSVRQIPKVHISTIETKAETTTKLLPARIKNLEEVFKVKCKTDFKSLGKVYRVYDLTFKWQHSCGKVYESGISERGIRQCPSCSSGTSKGEQEVAEFVSSLGCEVVIRSRDVVPPRELDIYIPSKKVAIEFDGTYWHSAKFEGRKKCMEKVEMCDAAGIKLITLQEHLWVNKRDAVKNRLASIFGSTIRVPARKTKLIEISSQSARVFLETNHLQGVAGASVQLGLEYDGELVAVATFGRPRWARQFNWELIRMASQPGITVQGGASKLISHFRQNHTGTIVSYADRCWSTGNVYKQIGFTLSHHTTPSYWWVHHSLGTYARYQTQKAKLPRLLGDLKKEFCIELSEEDNMRNAGFLPLFDRGNSVWTMN